MLRGLLLVAAASSLATPALAKDPCVSGPATGHKISPYSFLVASGPQRGQPTCFVCETAEKPGVVVFSRSLSEPLAKLMAACDDAVGSRPNDAMRSWMTILGEKTVSIDDLGKWAKQTGLKTTPVGVFDDPVGPPTFKLAEDADVTVVLFVDRKVTATFAYRSGELNEKTLKIVADEIGKLETKK
jgi:hypothetical protein